MNRKGRIYFILILCLVLLFLSTFAVLFINSINYPQIKYNQEIKTVNSEYEQKTFSIEEKQTPVQTQNVVSFSEPKVEKSITTKIKSHKSKKISVLVQATENNIDEVVKNIESAGGTVSNTYEIGNVVSAELPADNITSVADYNSVQGIYENKEYSALQESISDEITLQFSSGINYTGKGVIIAILDTGIDDANTLLSGKIISSAEFTGENHTDDVLGHGTSVAGIVASIAPDAQLLNVKVLSDLGNGNTENIIAGINWAVENNAKIISISFGGEHDVSDSLLNDALQEAINKGITVVIAAGNCGRNCVTAPADLENAIAVGAVDSNNLIASFSSGKDFGTYIKPDVVALGVDVLVNGLDNTNRKASGTSMSTPYIAGVAAQLLEKDITSSPSQIKEVIETNAIDLGIPGKDTEYGSGIVDYLINTTQPELNNGSVEFNETSNVTINEEIDQSNKIIKNNSEEKILSIDQKEEIIKIKNNLNNNSLNITSIQHINSIYDKLIYDTCTTAFNFNWYSSWYVYWYPDSSTDSDWFKITLNNNDEYLILLYPDYSGDDFDLFTYTSCTGSYFDYSDNGGSADDYVFVSGKQGTIYVKVNTFAWASGGPYTLAVSPTNGNADYCDFKAAHGYPCTTGKYDCDSDSECSSGLHCSGPLTDFSSSWYDACCPANTEWDGYSCVGTCQANSYLGCYGGNSYYYDSCGNRGNLYQTCTAPACTSWSGNYCKNNNVYHSRTCYASTCSSGTCGSSSYTDEQIVITCANGCSSGTCVTQWCGDGLCNNGETSSSCSGDCFARFTISGFNSISSISAVENQSISFNAHLKNTGTISGSINVESAIAPKRWAGLLYPSVYQIATYSTITPPCPANTYYQSKSVTLNAGEEQDIPFTVIAPNRNSVDSCDTNATKRSAWDTNGFRIISGTYSSAGSGYISFYSQNYTVNMAVATCNNSHTNGQTNRFYCDGSTTIREEYWTCSGTTWTTANKVNATCQTNYGCVATNTTTAICQAISSGCNSDIYCPTDYYCSRSGGIGTCKAITYTNECSPAGDYFCDNGWVTQCINNGKYLQKQQLSNCNSMYLSCDDSTVDSTRSCTATSISTSIDWANSGVDVNKQQGDLLRLKINSKQSGSVTLSYDTSVFTGDCSPGTLSVSTGTKECKLSVKSTASLGKKEIKVNNNIAVVNIINNPELLVVTDSVKLGQRYSDANGVDAILRQAYYNAEDKGVVYDLSWYSLGVSNPFGSFSSYNELLTEPSMFNNAYSIAVSQFTKEKCNGCKDVMIVGDDYVVPSYRRDIPVLEKKWFFFDSTRIQNIYTDINYINKNLPQFSDYYEMFYQDGKYEGKDVLFILPSGVTIENNAEVTRLKNILQTKYKIDAFQMDGKSVNCVDQSWFQSMKGRALIIIGTEDNNNAFKCMPFVSGDANRDAAFMQPNVWDNNNFALVINTNNNDVIKGLTTAIENGEIVKLKSESAYFFHIGTQYAGYTAMGVGIGSIILFSGGTAAPAIMISAGAVLEAISDSSNAADSCLINNEGAGWCGTSIAFAIIPFVPGTTAKQIIKKFDNAILNSQLANALQSVDSLITKYFRNLRKSKYIGNTAFENAAETVQDNIFIAKGSKVYIKDAATQTDIDNLLKEIPFDKLGRAKFIRQIGKAEDALQLPEGMITEIKIIDGADMVRITGSFDKGFYIDGKIYLSKYVADPTEILKNTLNHEYSHAFVDSKIGVVWDQVSDSIATLPADKDNYIRQLDEFLAERTAKEKITGHVSSYIIDKYDTVNRIKMLISSKMTKDEAAQILAQIKTQDITTYNLFKNQLISEVPAADNIQGVLALSDKYVELSNDLLTTGTISSTKINDVAQMTKGLIE